MTGANDSRPAKPASVVDQLKQKLRSCVLDYQKYYDKVDQLKKTISEYQATEANLMTRLKQTVADNDKMFDENNRLKALLREITLCGHTDIDPRIDYLEVQIDRDLWAEAKKAIGEE